MFLFIGFFLCFMFFIVFLYVVNDWWGENYKSKWLKASGKSMQNNRFFPAHYYSVTLAEDQQPFLVFITAFHFHLHNITILPAMTNLIYCIYYYPNASGNSSHFIDFYEAIYAAEAITSVPVNCVFIDQQQNWSTLYYLYTFMKHLFVS